MKKFIIELSVTPDELADIVIDYAKNVYAVRECGESPTSSTPSTPRKRRTPVSVAPATSSFILKKHYKGRAKSALVAYQAIAKQLSGHPKGSAIPRTKAVSAVKLAFMAEGYKESGASSCITALVKEGCLEVVK
jgi:hypothetical protein